MPRLPRGDVESVELKLRMCDVSLLTRPTDDVDRVGREIYRWRAQYAPVVIDMKQVDILARPRQHGPPQVHRLSPYGLTGVSIEGPDVVRHRGDVHDIARSLPGDANARDKQWLRLDTVVVIHLETETLDE